MRVEELGRILRDIDPAVVLVTEPVLARVVQKVAGRTWAVWRVPHSHCFVVDRFTLFKHVEPDELQLPSDHSLPQHVLLLERPAPELLAGSRDELLGRYWRLLFHACVHREIEPRLGALAPDALRERIEAIGPAAFEEVRNVLLEDRQLAPDADDRAVYFEFAAYFLELRFFNPALIPVSFPRLSAAEAAQVLDRDVDGAGLFRRTRPPGTPDPAPRTDDQSDESHDYYHKLVRHARRAAATGDTVAAAVLRTRAARVAPAVLTVPTQEAARADVHALVDRLRRAIGATDDESENWRRVLPSLLDKADQGVRPVEASILYDLQRACRDHEEPVYALDAAEWVLSVGKRPIRRPLDSERFVRVPAQLRTALHRLTAARLSDADRQALAALLRGAIERAERRLRERFRPILTDALHDAGLQPATLPERTALEKTVEELLDRVSASGFLTFADVRDAIARGQMKLPDLSGGPEYLGGDPLLRLDKRLAALMDGVYRRGESYTRLLEGLTAIGFGTQGGRWAVTNVAVPFLGAFLLAEFVWMLVFDRRAAVAKRAGETEPAFFSGWNAEWWFHLGWVALGAVFLLVIRSPRVRETVSSVFWTGYRVARYVCWDLPARVWSTPWVRALVASAVGQTVLNLGLKPLALSGTLWVLFREQLWDSGWAARAVTLAAAVFVVNTRPGRAAEQLLLTAARGLLDVLASAPALLVWVNDLFRDLLDALDWVLTRAEDWLRLRGRAGPLSVLARVIAGLLWMPFAFLVRFYAVVLIEPMINPLKLPLTLLCAKFVYPLLLLSPQILVRDHSSPLGYGSPLVAALAPYLSQPVGFVFVMGTLWLMPDALTYLVWEMRENWRLFRANRPTTLRPVAVGPHGETVKALLHRGFHSGTLPRLYARLRAGEREATRTDNWRDVRAHRQALEELEEAVRRFVARELVAVLNPGAGRHGWGGPVLDVGKVQLATNCVRVELTGGAGEAAWLAWEDRSSWLVAGWDRIGFLADLPPGPAREFENALAYLYRRAGVDLVREQVRAALPPAALFDVSPAGLLVQYGPLESGPPVLYDLFEPGDELRPLTPAGRRPAVAPALEARRVMFRRVELTWGEWEKVWDARPDQPTSPDAPVRPPFGPREFTHNLLPARAPSPAGDKGFSAELAPPLSGIPREALGPAGEPREI
ncbi:hypothetical protein R5W23_004757 [Gemmata sp. JC673]|uniref:Uncharacterized protein n=1 Tax=Gemmata algarum TaxID=2975278 RepID=A0ABU5F6T4_9BACT|nr:hypothetical protein [Gemmata algarum]MDY3563257.1 hypothetical protein [Gemmata algarum]